MKRKIRQRYSDIFTPDMVKYYRKHIIEFVYDIIFQRDPQYELDDQQVEFLLSVQNYKRTAAKSGKGVGKTSAFSFLILWFLCVYENPKVVCTAPSFPTLKSALWPEVALWLGRSAVKGIFEHTSERLYLIEKPKNWWAEPRTARDKESMQGLHADNLLILIDEGSGVSDEIFETLDSTLTQSYNKIATAGNPTRVSGFFYDCFNKFGKRWRTHTFNAEDSTLTQKDQIEYWLAKYGRDSAIYKVNVLGEFPEGNPDSFISLSDVQDAVNRSVAPLGDIEIGIDVARFGDDYTVLYWRHGFKVYPRKSLPKSSTPEVVELVLKTVEEIRSLTGSREPIAVKVDDVGLGGGVTDYLRLDREHNIRVVPCNFGGKGDEVYQNETSIMWGNLKDQIRQIDLPDDQRLIEELSTRRWELSTSGRILIEPKSKFKKEFKESPDRSDALILCFAKKQEERRVLKEFDPLDKEIVRDSIHYMGETRYGSIHYTKDLFVSTVYCAWDGTRLYVYDEYYSDDPFIAIASDLRDHLPLSSIYGNERLFNDKTDGLSRKFRKYNIHIKENYKYDELSAIELLSLMISNKMIIISSRCKKLIDQLSNWKSDTIKSKNELDFGLCYALLNILSVLKKSRKNTCFNLGFNNNSNGYNNSNTSLSEKINRKYELSHGKNSWMFS